MPKLQCHDNHITIALLNIRSIVPKLPDIASDDCLKCVSVQCFCETWLTQSDPSPVLQGHQISIRCDRASGDNKGGVMISIPEHMQPTSTHRYALNGIEAVSTILLLPDTTQIHVALLYRSPSVPLQTLTSLMSRVLNHVSMSSLPSIVLGDFNGDILHQSNSRVVTFMSSHGYTQVVNSPTTARGTLIDHVYCNSLPSNITVGVQDTYYSDHDSLLLYPINYCLSAQAYQMPAPLTKHNYYTVHASQCYVPLAILRITIVNLMSSQINSITQIRTKELIRRHLHMSGMYAYIIIILYMQQ